MLSALFGWLESEIVDNINIILLALTNIVISKMTIDVTIACGHYPI